MARAVFLDRDGTINVEKSYLYRIEDFEFLPGALEALRMLQTHGFRLVIITNQSGVARGYYTEQDVAVLHRWLAKRLKVEGIVIDGCYYCPHHPQAAVGAYRRNCACRKPGTELFFRAARELGISFEGSYAIGDKLRDCAICRETACRGFLIGENEQTDILESVRMGKIARVEYANDLYECARRICGSV